MNSINSGQLYPVLKKILNELNPRVVEHGEHVAYLELMMARGRDLPDDRKLENLMLACFAHDIGAYKTDKFMSPLRFDARNTLGHCIYGYLFMKYFSPLKEDSEVILYHHAFYSEKAEDSSPYYDDGVLIHMLERIDVLNSIYPDEQMIIDKLAESRGDAFNPDDVDDFIRFNESRHILQKLNSGEYRDEVRAYFNGFYRSVRLIEPIVDMLAYEIDFKSEQTVIHTITTSLICRCLGQCMSLPQQDIDELFLAAKLHDLGKIKIPTEVLEKPARLTDDEYEIIKTHTGHTLEIIEDLFPESVVDIATHHHERLDGRGYPNGLTESELSTKDRILQVADVASALIYKRSYKSALSKEKVIDILQEEKANRKLDSDVVDVFTEHYDEILEYATDNSAEIISRYENLQNEYREYLSRYSELNHELDMAVPFTLGGSNAIPG